ERKCLISRTAITCAPSATRSTRKASSTSCREENDLLRPEENDLLLKSGLGALDLRKIPPTWMGHPQGSHLVRVYLASGYRRQSTGRRAIGTATSCGGAAHGSASGQSARRQTCRTRSDLGARAQRSGRFRSRGARGGLLHLLTRAASRASGRLGRASPGRAARSFGAVGRSDPPGL